MQQKQLGILKDLTHADFVFVPTDKNNFGVKYYLHKCESDQEYDRIIDALSQYDSIFYGGMDNPDKTASVLIFENELDKNRYENITYGLVTDATKPIGKLNGNDIFLEPVSTISGRASNIVCRNMRAIAIVNINGKRLPFYVSSGMSGKDLEYGIASGKWYPLQGISDGGWLNKMPEMTENPYPELDAICKILEQKYPAANIKQMALESKLPIANENDLLQNANSAFPEGAAFNERSMHQYYRNHLIYLPSVIDDWRSGPKNYLEISAGPLKVPGLHILNKIRKSDLVASTDLDGACIWFRPINSQLKGQTKGGSIQDIKMQLNDMGVSITQFVTSDNKDGFGIPVRNFVDYFKAKQAEAFSKATQNIGHLSQSEKPQETEKQNMLKSLLRIINR